MYPVWEKSIRMRRSPVSTRGLHQILELLPVADDELTVDLHHRHTVRVLSSD